MLKNQVGFSLSILHTTLLLKAKEIAQTLINESYVKDIPDNWEKTTLMLFTMSRTTKNIDISKWYEQVFKKILSELNQDQKNELLIYWTEKWNNSSLLKEIIRNIGDISDLKIFYVFLNHTKIKIEETSDSDSMSKARSVSRNLFSRKKQSLYDVYLEALLEELKNRVTTSRSKKPLFY